MLPYELSQPRLSILATTGDRTDLEATLCRLLAEGVTAPTLELVGFTTRDKLLALGTWAIDADSLKARALFRELAEQRVLARLGVERVHLRGCFTGATERGRRTLDTLAGILGLEVTGTTDLACLRRELVPTPTRSLDLDALPARSLASGVQIATIDTARAILQLVRRTGGAELPGLLALPHRALALPSYVAGAYHHVDVLLDHEYVRVAGDLVFPVDDPGALRTLLER